MTAREEFEAWLEDQTFVTDWSRIGEGYVRTSVQIAWLSWQASRAAALEEAVKECEMMQARYERLIREGDSIRAGAAEQCAIEIRALKD